MLARPGLWIARTSPLRPHQTPRKTINTGGFLHFQNRFSTRSHILKEVLEKSAAKLTLAKLPITKSQLLKQAHNPVSRAWVHIKWPLTRNNRSFSADDFTAFASWLFMGNVLWIILGTTTFGLVTMYSIDKFDKFYKTIKGELDTEKDDGSARKSKDNGFLGYLSGAILSHGLGVKIVFEQGNVVPQLKDGMLKFKNVKVYLTKLKTEQQNLVFSAAISELNMSLSFKKWYDGQGLIYNLEIFGMHAKVYKNEELPQADLQLLPTDKLIPLSSMAMSFSRYNDATNVPNDTNEHNISVLENLQKSSKSSFIDSNYTLEHVKLHDSYIELFENQDKTPFQISIFNCDMPRLRGNRLLIDFFNASNVTGAVNNSMFTIHKHQTFSDSDNVVRFKLDGINMGSLSKANPQLKFNWIANGKAEIVADIRLPDLEEKEAESTVISGFFKRAFNEFREMALPSEQTGADSESDSNLLKGAIAAIYETFKMPKEQISNDNEYVIINFKVKFTDLKATLPLHLPTATSTQTPFITLHNLRSLIGYVNGIEDLAPLVIKTTVIEKLSDLYDLDNISQTRVFDAIVSDIYDDLLRMNKLDEKRIIEENLNRWSHSVVSQLLLLGLGVLA